MGRADSLSPAIMDILRGKLGDRMDEYAFPPPIFVAMQGEFLELDLDAGTLTAQFPVLESYLNPYGAMQGGMVAAAVDNTLGPLSMLVAPPNVTRQLEMTYSRPVTLDLEYIVVYARLLERKDRWLFFKADVRSRERLRLARSKAVHWIVDEDGFPLPPAAHQSLRPRRRPLAIWSGEEHGSGDMQTTGHHARRS